MQTRDQLIEEVRRVREKIANGKASNASDTYEYVYEQAGDDDEVNFELGLLCLQDNVPALAVKHFRIAVDRAPEDIQRLGFLGCALQMQHNNREAYDVLQQAIARGNDDLDVLSSLGFVCLRLSDFEGAREYLERALEKKPGDHELHVGLTVAWGEGDEHEKALWHIRKALENGATSENAYFLLGRILSELGRLDEAVEQLEKTVRKHKTFGPAYQALAAIKKFTEEDYPFIRKTEKMLDHSMPAEHRVCFHFALGRMYEGVKDWEAAIDHYHKGNLLQKGTGKLDSETRDQRKLMRFMNQATMSELMKRGHESRQPVFVVGMPRSGTTLIESIIAAHPDAAGAGELNEIYRTRQEILPEKLTRRSLARVRDELTDDRVRDYAEQYLAVLRKGREDAARIVDKRPGNFMDLGFVATLFPNATIINAIRHPLDVAVSCYFQRFTEIRWANDFDTIAQVYAMYAQCMAHWKKVLPEGQIVDVHYENLVQDQEGEARRILAACGLEWDERVLDFHKRGGVVRTASIGQVRQPIYNSSRMRWTRYAPYLGELAGQLMPWLPESRAELEELGVALPRPGIREKLLGGRRQAK